MKALITFTFLLIFGWVIGVTFFGSEIAQSRQRSSARQANQTPPLTK